MKLAWSLKTFICFWEERRNCASVSHVLSRSSFAWVLTPSAHPLLPTIAPWQRDLSRAWTDSTTPLRENLYHFPGSVYRIHADFSSSAASPPHPGRTHQWSESFLCISPARELFKRQSLVLWVWGGTWESVFLLSSQVLLLLLHWPCAG